MHFWLLNRYAFNFKKMTDLNFVFSLIGIILGVAFLVLAMAGFSGFENTLKRSIIDVTGDVVVYKKGGKIENGEELIDKIKNANSEVEAILPFLMLEAIFAHKGKIQTVFLQGIDWQLSQGVLNLEHRYMDIHRGEISQTEAYLGTDLAIEVGLVPGEDFRVVVASPSSTSTTDFHPKSAPFSLRATIDFGKYEFNKKFILADLSAVQELGKMKGKLTGFRIKISDSEKVDIVVEKIQDALGPGFAVKGWNSINKNLFSAVAYEKYTIFFILLIMVVVACFNISTTLFVSVQRKYPDISVLKTLGARPIDILFLFSFQGLFLGVIGCSLGLVLGLAFAQIFSYLQTIFPLLPKDVYKVSHVYPVIKFSDIFLIVGSTLIICLISTILPALRGATLTPVKGLRYE